MSRIVRFVLEFVTCFILSVIGVSALIAFIAVIVLFPSSLFTRIVSFITIALAIFMLVGLLFCCSYDFYNEYIASRKHHS